MHRISKPKEGDDAFCESLQNEVNDIPTQNKMQLVDNLNAKIGNIQISSIMNHYNREHMNSILI